jgi:hypothetical protein
MSKFWIGALIAAVVAVALWQFGVFGEKSSDEPTPTPGRAGEPGKTDGTELLPGARTPGRDEPKEEPKPEEFPLQSKLRVLFLLERTLQWPQYMGIVLKSDPQIAYTYYSVHPLPEEIALVSPEETPVVDRPTPALFDGKGFDVLVVGALDPGEIGDDFWKAATDRVRAGQLGVLIWPDLPPTTREKPQASPVHPMLTHPLFRALLPVEEADALKGKPDPDGRSSPVPGMFRVEARFQVTDAGTTHPASRIVPFPQWSRTMWNAGAAGQTAWGSKFVYPVTKVKTGAVTLLNALPEKGKAIPMFVQGPPEDGRVLWFGAHDFGDATYRSFGPALEKWNAVIHNTFVWLAGRAPRDG